MVEYGDVIPAYGFPFPSLGFLETNSDLVGHAGLLTQCSPVLASKLWDCGVYCLPNKIEILTDFIQESHTMYFELVHTHTPTLITTLSTFPSSHPFLPNFGILSFFCLSLSSTVCVAH